MGRIKFLHSWDTAKEDKTVFNDWQHKAIPTRYACRLIASNNRLEYVSEEDFIETAASLGYRRGVKCEYEEGYTDDD